jgi:hypothetical protein
MTAVSQSLRRLQRAYVAGRDRPPPSASPRWFGQLLRKSVGDRVPPHEWSFMDSCADRRDAALEAARDGRLNESRAGVDEVWRRLRAEPLSREAQVMVRAFLEPAEAYLEYKLRNDRRARELVLHASSLDELMVTEFGFELLSVHRLHLGHNMLRVHTQRGEHDQAVELAGSFMDYLELRHDCLPRSLASARSVLDSAPVQIVHAYFDRFCGEVALVLAGPAGDRAAEVFARLAHHAACGPTECGTRAHLWLAVKHSALAGDHEEALQAAADLLRHGRGSEPSLWIAGIADAVACCRALGGDGERLADWIDQDVAGTSAYLARAS